jgi:hypothetical protein
MSMMKALKGEQSSISKIKLSVCVPCRDMMHSAFSFDLCKLLEYNALVGIETTIHFHVGTLIVNQREQLVQMAFDAGSTHILWLDSDMMFPSDTAHQLLKHQKPIVAANYVTRQYPHKTVAYTDKTDWNSYLLNSAEQHDLVSVDAVGMGCILTETSVFKQLSKPYFKTSWSDQLQDHVGEDFNLCYDLTALGYEILIDNNISLKVQHLGTFAFSHSLVTSK